MTEKKKIVQGTNGKMEVFDTHVVINHANGRNLLDYVGQQEIILNFNDVVRVDFMRPALFKPGYFRFVLVGEDVPNQKVKARTLNGDKKALIVDAMGSTNVLELDEINKFIQEKITKEEAEQ